MSNARNKANIPALNFSSTGIDDNATSTAVTIDSSQKVGIGTSSPRAKTEIYDNSVSGIFSATDLSTWRIFQVRNNIENNTGTGAGIALGGDGSSDTETAGIVGISTNTTGGAVDLALLTAEGNVSKERIRIVSAGNVGINTTNPSSKLDVKSQINVTTSADISLQAITASRFGYSGAYRCVVLGGTDVGVDNNIAIGYDPSVNSSGSFTGNGLELLFKNGVKFTTPNSTDTGFNLNHLVLIDGNVGINTSTPSEKLHVNGHIIGNSLNMPNNTSSPPSGVTIHKPSNDIMAFRTASTERMRIDNAGRVGIGTTSLSRHLTVYSTGEPPARFQRNQGDNAYRTHIEFIREGNMVGEINCTNTSTTYATSSDYRLKENVSYDFDATTRLKDLKPARFNFIENPDITVDGFLAHEVKSIVPEAVIGEKDAVDENGNPVYQGIDQAKLVPLLVKTIQELEARITALENK